MSELISSRPVYKYSLTRLLLGRIRLTLTSLRCRKNALVFRLNLLLHKRELNSLQGKIRDFGKTCKISAEELEQLQGLGHD